MDKKDKYENCNHIWHPQFHELIDKTKTTMRVAVAINCEVCGMWRTKVLEFRFPEYINNN